MSVLIFISSVHNVRLLCSERNHQRKRLRFPRQEYNTRSLFFQVLNLYIFHLNKYSFESKSLFSTNEMHTVTGNVYRDGCVAIY